MEKNVIDLARVVKSKNENLTLNHITERFYSFTNEALNEYASYFKDKATMLSVIASGDQIFTAILNGTKKVDAFDINRYAKYYFYLKKAALESLSRDEFVQMFIAGNGHFEREFDKIFRCLDSDSISFWGPIIGEWEYYYSVSNLFHNYSPTQIFIRNPYLGREEYDKMKALLKDVEINLRDGNLLALADSYKDRYDLIYISNILDYFNFWFCSEIVGKLKLTPNGYLVAYSFSSFLSAFYHLGFEASELSTEHSLLIKKGSK